MIKLTGFTEIDKVIKQLPSQVTHSILQSIYAKSVQPYITAAKQAAPKRTGGTEKSIGVVKPGIKRSGSIGLIEAGPRRKRYDGYRATFSEFGTKARKAKSGANRGKMVAKPFLRPSWERKQNEVRNGIAVATGQGIYAFMKRTIKRYG